MSEMLQGASVGLMYSHVVDKIGPDIIKVTQYHPSYEAQCDKMTKFRMELRHGTIENLKEWHELCQVQG